MRLKLRKLLRGIVGGGGSPITLEEFRSWWPESSWRHGQVSRVWSILTAESDRFGLVVHYDAVGSPALDRESFAQANFISEPGRRLSSGRRAPHLGSEWVRRLREQQRQLREDERGAKACIAPDPRRRRSHL